MAEYLKMYMNGQLVDASQKKRIDVVCPATDEKFAEVAYASAEDVDEIVSSSLRGFRYWSSLAPAERKDWMLKLQKAFLERKEDLVVAVMKETGKQRAVAEDDFDKLQGGLSFFPEAISEYSGEMITDAQGEADHKIVYEPIGPVAAFIAWNFPLLNLGYKIGPALAAGCSLIVKPSQKTPYAAYLVGKTCAEIGFPPGVLNIVAGDNAGFGSGLSRHKDIAGLTMIGSTSAGLKVIETSTTSIKRFSMELGGNAPFLVFDDADISTALDVLVTMKTANTGQICVAPNRIFLQDTIANEFTQELINRLKKITLGYPLEQPEVDMGPVIDRNERDRLAALVEKSITGGMQKAFGDGPIPAKGAFYPVTVLTGMTEENPFFQDDDEWFGPIVAVGRFRSEEEAVTLANKTRTGLASYLFTRDVDRIRRISGALDFGEVMVNGCKWDTYLPHIGVKNSGIGTDCSTHALLDYLRLKRVTTIYE